MLSWLKTWIPIWLFKASVCLLPLNQFSEISKLLEAMFHRLFDADLTTGDSLNYASITLFPKKTESMTVEDFRPPY